ncbi:HD domain-containing protein [Vagococcus silagei]|uniref:HD domain-containing protein n=1 Tax=Vagococcus silagei TaxID=2508885 RepID=A0A4S3B4N0_9ENTE|nr:HD domain-containing protein [Vagococcus silagei]THB62021.1 HD domain-containing protein [Vagococcus silagei]
MKYFERLTTERVFRDPIHNYVHVEDALILDLINTKEMQRLRRIKQLGTSSFTFHGAEHSRFGHSLGVYEITRRICQYFKRHYSLADDPVNGWDVEEKLIAQCAALLHDIGHGPYSHTFEGIFNTDHEEITVQIITSKETEVNQVLRKVSPEFPEQVASVIQKTYPNPQVVQLISSQIDADRMDYLLRDAYYTGTEYGTFDLTRILRVIRPHKEGIVFQMNGMHAVEDYIVSRYQMYMQIYFHPVSRGMEVILDRLLKRATEVYHDAPSYFEQNSILLIPFLKGNFTLEDYLKLDDGVLLTSFILWSEHSDPILSDLAKRFLNRKPLKSISFDDQAKHMLPLLTDLIETVGFDTKYYTAISSSFDLPYDFYAPAENRHRTQIELYQMDGSLIELSKASYLVNAITGKITGDKRLFFPKEMLASHQSDTYTLFEEEIKRFNRHIKNGTLIEE